MKRVYASLTANTNANTVNAHYDVVNVALSAMNRVYWGASTRNAVIYVRNRVISCHVICNAINVYVAGIAALVYAAKPVLLCVAYATHSTSVSRCFSGMKTTLTVCSTNAGARTYLKCVGLIRTSTTTLSTACRSRCVRSANRC